ncbi:MAG: DUF3078 domain-containing protein [Bacteroidia bacterium]
MKKNIIVIWAVFLLPVLGYAQQAVITGIAQKAMNAPKFDTVKKWDIGGPVNISFSQSSFSNWAAGGQNSSGLTAMASLHANYTDSAFSWLNDAELGYGFQRVDGMPLQKTTDQIELTSSVGYKIFDHVSLSFLTNFQTQFQPGYTNTADTTLLSKFMAPAYWVLALGLNYKPDKTLTVFLSPITARFVFVEDQALADQGAFGVNPAVYNSAGVKIQNGKQETSEIGAYFKGNYTVTFAKNINLNTNLELFSNYLKDPQNIVINWTTFLRLKVSKYLSATFNTQLIYDNTILTPIYKVENGVNTLAGKGPRTQFKDVLGIGLGFKI